MFERMLTALFLASVLGACAVGPVDNFCQIASPIFVGAADVLTDETVGAILAHNEVGAALCGWG